MVNYQDGNLCTNKSFHSFAADLILLYSNNVYEN